MSTPYDPISPKQPENPAQLEEQIIDELTTNPLKQYRYPQPRTPSTPYTSPMAQYSNSPYITGKMGEDSSHDSRQSVFSAIVAKDDVDSIPTNALFLGRVGQNKPRQLVQFIERIPTQREFFENSGYTEDMLKNTILPSAIVACTTAVLVTPFERARAIVQANSASISALQDADEKNMLGKAKLDVNSPHLAEVEGAVAEIEKKVVEKVAENSETIDNKTPPPRPQNPESKAVQKQKQSTLESLRNLRQPTTKLNTLTHGIQPERKDHFSKLFSQNPNTSASRTPILRPNPYDIFSRRQILIFEEEYAKVAAMEEYKTLTGYEKAMKTKNLNPILLKNIQISQYDIFNHHIEHGMSSRHVGGKFSEVGLDGMNLGSRGDQPGSDGQQIRSKMKPIENDIFPQNQSDSYRGFHRYYREDRYTTIRQALRALYKYNGLKGCFQLSSIPVLTKLIPFLFLVPFYRPWKLWMTQISPLDTVFDAEVLLGENHSRLQILTMLSMFPLYALLTAAHVNKTAFYPNYSLQTSPELQSWKQRFVSFHLTNDTFASYTTKTPQSDKQLKKSWFGRDKPTETAANEKYPEFSAKSAQNKDYKTRQNNFIESLLTRQLKRSRTRIILDQLMTTNGPKATLFNGLRPGIFISILYYLTYVAVFGSVGTVVVEKMHDLRSAMKPPPPQGHQHDINLEIGKAMIPLTAATLAAQYISYPLNTIRHYIAAADTPGYVTFNKNANPLPYGIAVDQYRLPFRQVQPIKTKEKIKIAYSEIKRQYGWRGFFHGASIIPTVRLPQALIVSSTLFYTLHKQWPAMNQLIDLQHFYQYTPTVL